MAQDWSYALLTQTARRYGDPDKYVQAIYQEGINTGIQIGIQESVPIAYAAGIEDEKQKMYPMTTLISLAALGIGIGGTKLFCYLKKRCAISKKQTKALESKTAHNDSISADSQNHIDSDNQAE